MLQGSCNYVARMLHCRKLIQRKALTHTSSEKAMQQKALPRFFVQDAWRLHGQGQGQRRGRGQGSRKTVAQRLQ